MSPSKLRARVIKERAEWVHRMLEEVRRLPLGTHDEFFSDARNVAAAESCLRRALEALLDLARHVLSKGFGEAVTEYKDLGPALARLSVLGAADGDLLRTLAGYRNRMVHFYNEIGSKELYEIATGQLGDVERVLEAILVWIRSHPDRIDRSL